MIKKALLIFFSLIISIGACGCMDTNVSKEQYALKIEEQLESKYGGKFSVIKLGSTLGGIDDTVIQAWCKCNSGEYVNIEFMAQIDKESFEVKDSYINLYAADEISKSLEGLYHEESIVLTQFETPSVFSSERTITDINNFLKSNRSYYITSFIFIKSDLSSETLSGKIFDYAKSLEKLEYKNLSVIVFVVKDLDANISNKFFLSNKKYDDFISDSNVKKHTGFQLRNQELLTSIEDIKKVLFGGK
ncbi:MAG: hypothetical protein RR012_08545 [Oscillospiraceae bacterium]